MLRFQELLLDDPVMNKVYRFRCEVLCGELGIFRKQDYSDGMEQDQ